MPARALRLPRRSADPVADLAQLVLVMSPDQLEQFAAGLAGDDLALLESVIAEHVGVGWRTDPATFAHHLDRAYQVWRYVQLLSDRFRAAVMGESKRQLWNLPARYGKSLLASQWGPTWALDRTEGRARFLLISYGKQLSVENALGIRERLVEYQDQLHPGCQLAEGRKRQDRGRRWRARRLGHWRDSRIRGGRRRRGHRGRPVQGLAGGPQRAPPRPGVEPVPGHLAGPPGR
jgi:hypothetical protein